MGQIAGLLASCGDTGQSKGSYIEPAIDPLALLDVAEKFNLAAPKQIARLRQEFTSRVEKIVGHSLTPQQVSQMHKLLTSFNPAKPK